MAAVGTSRHDKQRLGDDDSEGREIQKKAEFHKEAERLKRQCEKLQNESGHCRRTGWSDGHGALEQYEKALQEERQSEKMNLQKELVKIHNGVKKFQIQLTDVKPSPELIDKLKEIMAEVEISINTFKEDQRLRFEDLLKEEKMCCQEIAAFEKRMENWSMAVRLEPKHPYLSKVKVAKAPDENLPSEVRALESFLQRTGGSHGGWDQYDHEAFLKVWTKHSGRPAYRKEAKLYLPSRSLEEIEEHEDWYLELLHLQDKRKEAIQRWKTGRQQERQARLRNQEEEEEKERREREAQAQQQRCEEERRETGQQLEAWREQRRRKQEQEEDRRRAEEILQKRRAKEERRRQLELKLALEEHLHVRREEEEERERKRREEEHRLMEERRMEAALGIKRFQERDFHKVETKVQEKQHKKHQAVERQKKIAAQIKAKVEGNISRDRSRLAQPTKGWEERMKHIGPTGGGPVLHMFHRAVPSWRQGL